MLQWAWLMDRCWHYWNTHALLFTCFYWRSCQLALLDWDHCMLSWLDMFTNLCSFVLSRRTRHRYRKISCLICFYSSLQHGVLYLKLGYWWSWRQQTDMIIGGGLMDCPPSHALPQLMGKTIYIYIYVYIYIRQRPRMRQSCTNSAC